MTFVKICGLTNTADALCAAEAGADLLGFIFYPSSPRAISLKTARDTVRAVRQWQIQHGRSQVLVGVFVKESPVHMLRVLAEVGLDAAQLHGGEVAAVRALGGRAYLALKEWKVEGDGSRDGNSPFDIPHKTLPQLLLDANHPTLWGGSGQRADESLAATVARQHRLLLAGGLTPENVADAVRAVRPWGVDVASGTEAAPGIKDHAKVRAFVQAAVGAGHEWLDAG